MQVNRGFYAALVGVIMLVTACATMYRNHGYVPSDEELESVIVGVDTRGAVEELLGLPTTGGVTREDGFYYIASRWEHYAYRKPRPVEREIVAITFDSESIVENIARYGLEDGKVVVLSRRVTDGGAGEISFIRQLMGDFGSFNANQIFGDP